MSEEKQQQATASAIEGAQDLLGVPDARPFIWGFNGLIDKLRFAELGAEVFQGNSALCDRLKQKVRSLIETGLNVIEGGDRYWAFFNQEDIIRLGRLYNGFLAKEASERYQPNDPLRDRIAQAWSGWLKQVGGVNYASYLEGVAWMHLHGGAVDSDIVRRLQELHPLELNEDGRVGVSDVQVMKDITNCELNLLKQGELFGPFLASACKQLPVNENDRRSSTHLIKVMRHLEDSITSSRSRLTYGGFSTSGMHEIETEVEYVHAVIGSLNADLSSVAARSGGGEGFAGNLRGRRRLRRQPEISQGRAD